MIYLLLLLSSLVMAGDLTTDETALRELYLKTKKTQLSPEQVSKLLSSSLTAADKAKILSWYKSEIQFQKKYDEFQNKKLSYMADKVLKTGECLRTNLIQKVSLSTKRKNEIIGKWNALVKQRQAYQKNIPLFGTKEDYLRVLSYNRLYEAQNAFALSMEEALNVDDDDTIRVLDNVFDEVMNLPYYVKIMYAMSFERQSPQGETPILDAIGEGVASMGRQWDVKVTWQGLDKLPEPVYDGKTLNIVAFEHANSYLDTIAQAAIPAAKRKGLGFYGAAKYVFPEAWVKSLDKSDHYIVVNQGKEVSRTLEIIQDRKLHGFLAAGEGLTPSGLFDTRPVSSLFTDTYWELKEKGLEINIIPMSYPNNFRLYNHWKIKSENPKRVLGVVESSLPSHSADSLLNLTNEKSSIGIWLRSIWHNTLVTDSTRLLSSPPFGEIENAVNLRLWNKIQKKLKTSCY